MSRHIEFERIPQLLENIHLDTLLLEKNLHVLTMSVPEGESEGEKVPDLKIVFSKNNSVGVIIDKIYYMKPEFFKGGRFHNAFMEAEMNTIIQTYQLTGAQALLVDQASLIKLGRIVELRTMAMTEVDVNKLDEYQEEAGEIAGVLQHDDATKIFNEIAARYNSVFEKSKKSEQELTIEVGNIIEQITKTEDVHQINELRTRATEILSKLKDSEETKGLQDYMKKIVEAKSKPPVDTKSGLDDDAGDYVRFGKLYKKISASEDKKEIDDLHKICKEILEKYPNSKRIQDQGLLLDKMMSAKKPAKKK